MRLKKYLFAEFDLSIRNVLRKLTPKMGFIFAMVQWIKELQMNESTNIAQQI